MNTMHPIAARFQNAPAMVAPESHALFSSLLQQVAAHDMAEAERLSAASDEFWPEDPDSFLAMLRPYIVRDGILQIPIKGVLLHDFPYQLFDWATGYEYILAAFRRGCEDANVRGIALVIDSPGGMVAGCFDAADKALTLKAEHGKPVRAYAAESAYSAAYVWACVGDTITVSRTGGVGSIGVVTSHFDVSVAMEKAGYKVTFIHAGAHKVDGNAYEALPDDVKARIQTRIDELYAIFVDHVAATRPLDAAAVRATEALTFTASQSLSNGLADEIGALDDALAAFAVDLSNPPETGDEEMSDKKQDTSAGDPAADTSTAAPEAVDTAAVASAAVAADRERRKAIMQCDEAEGHTNLASHLADDTDLDADAAKGILAAAAKDVPEAANAPTPFSQTMDVDDHPDVGASTAAAGESETSEDSADDIVALAGRMGLKGFTKPATA